MELWPPSVPTVVSALLQFTVCAMYALVQLLDKVTPNPQRVSVDANWIRGTIRDMKIRAIEGLLRRSSGPLSLERTHAASEVALSDECREFVRKWDELVEDESKVATAHGEFDRWRGRLWYWLLLASGLLILTLTLPRNSDWWLLGGAILLVSEILVLYWIQAQARFLLDERKKSRYVNGERH